MSGFVNLHVHSCFSSLDGAQTPTSIANRAKELNQTAIALTDHGNMHGLIDFHDACRKAGIKPIFGQEFYLSPRERTFKEAIEGVPPAYHLTTLAMTEEGLRNLYKMSSIAFLEGFYYKPRVDIETLKEYNKDIICLSGCLKGTIQWYLGEYIRTKEERFLVKAYSDAETLRDIFGDRFYIEVQLIVPVQVEIFELQKKLAKDLDIQCVATCDAHYSREEDSLFHQQLVCLAIGKTMLSRDENFFAGNYLLHIHSSEEMAAKFPLNKELLKNSCVIADRCQDIVFAKKYDPMFPIFSNSYEEDIRLFEQLSWQGLEYRKLENNPLYQKQLKYEIQCIKDMGFPSYFLVVADYMIWAKENGIHCGAGRGSAAGSLVAYCLRITEVDPIRHDLLFERFLNPGRKELPDIDSDFEPRARELLLRYLQGRYGEDKVAQIATFGEFKPRGSVRDFARVQGESYELGDEMSRMIPPDVRGKSPTWTECLRAAPELTQGKFANVTLMAHKSEGLVRQPGIHAGGVVIGPTSLNKLCPLMRGREGETVIQWDKDVVERLGLVKMDILGLTACTTIRMCLNIIEQVQGEKIDIYTVPQDDTKVYDMICSGDTDGLFQFDTGGGIKELTLRIQPKTVDDLAIISALFRPGPLDSGMTESFARRRAGKEEVEYITPELEPILKDTYGCLVYQESVMKIAVELAGYTLPEADDIRKAVGKKKADLMAKQEPKLLQGMKDRGIKESKAREIWDAIKTNAEYSFNRSHAVAYAYTTYQMGWLKANYPVEFYCALLTQHMGEQSKIVEYMQCSRTRGIKVLPPDINESNDNFTVAGNVIRFGFGAIKDIGTKACEKIIQERNKGKFTNIYDLFERTQPLGVNKKTFEALAKSGALDSLNVPRAGILELTSRFIDHKGEIKSYEKKVETYKKRLDIYNIRQQEIQQAKESNTKAKPPLKEPKEPENPIRPNVEMGQELSFSEMLTLERETMGLYISGHPLEEYRSNRDTVHIQAIYSEYSHNEEVELLGIIENLKVITTKASGKKMAFLTLGDMTGTIEGVVFPLVFQKEAESLANGKIIGVVGKVDAKVENSKKIIIQRIYQPAYIKKREKLIQYNSLVINETSEETIDAIIQILKDRTSEIQMKIIDVKINETIFRLETTRKIGQNILNRLLSLPDKRVKGNVI